MTTETNVATRGDIHALVDALPDAELAEAARLLTGLSTSDPVLRSLLLAPVDDEPLTDEDIAAIDEAKAGMARGEWVPHEDVRREFGW